MEAIQIEKEKKNIANLVEADWVEPKTKVKKPNWGAI